MKDKNIIIVILVIIIFFGGGYILGTKNKTKKAIDVTSQSVTSQTSVSSYLKESSSSSFKDVESTNTSSSQRNLPDELLPYSDEEIEYARVWLAVMGEDYLERIGDNSQFKLGVTLIPKDEHLHNGKKDYNVRWPKDVIALHANATALGQVYYSSNFDGTVSVYTEMPSHWQLSQEESEDKNFMINLLNKIVSTTKVVSVPAGDPQKVKEIIERLK